MQSTKPHTKHQGLPPPDESTDELGVALSGGQVEKRQPVEPCLGVQVIRTPLLFHQQLHVCQEAGLWGLYA